jgi:hypothetical protein
MEFSIISFTFLFLSTPIDPLSVGHSVRVRSMGEISCAHWNKLSGIPTSDGHTAVTLNFALGYLTGRSSRSRRHDTLPCIDEASLAIWLDR